MTRNFVRLCSAFALVALCLPVVQASAQQDLPAAPAADVSAPAPSEPITFPKPDPANFTAASPSKETVNAYLQINWGFDDNRVWQV